MIFSHTQISQYLRCPRSYRFRYLDGWQEKETRAAMAFGQSFEKALGAYFLREDPSAESRSPVRLHRHNQLGRWQQSHGRHHHRRRLQRLPRHRHPHLRSGRLVPGHRHDQGRHERHVVRHERVQSDQPGLECRGHGRRDRPEPHQSVGHILQLEPVPSGSPTRAPALRRSTTPTATRSSRRSPSRSRRSARRPARQARSSTPTPRRPTSRFPGPSGPVPSVFLFSTLDGTIAGWNPASNGGTAIGPDGRDGHRRRIHRTGPGERRRHLLPVRHRLHGNHRRQRHRRLRPHVHQRLRHHLRRQVYRPQRRRGLRPYNIALLNGESLRRLCHSLRGS